MSIISILNIIFGKINLKSKFEQDFLKELFDLLPSIRGRFNFCNFERYSKYNELTFRRHFSKFFDWLSFNFALIELALSKANSPCLAIIDASFIAKSGKKTFGYDTFWSGCASKAKKGLEISCLALAEIKTGLIWTLDVTQTPFGLAKTSKNLETYSRIDFYIEQIFDCLAYLKNTRYIVADGYYAKNKMFDAILSINKHLITKLRSDADMKYPPQLVVVWSGRRIFLRPMIRRAFCSITAKRVGFEIKQQGFYKTLLFFCTQPYQIRD